MSGRASNQVNNLRALFEQNKNSVSPPSRDRSPAGPEAVTGSESRPISKVRTSFIAVQRSGSMALAVGLNKTNNEENNKLGQTGESEPPSVMNGIEGVSPKMNGDKTLPQSPMENGKSKADEGKHPDHNELANTTSPEESQTSSSKSVGANKDGSIAQAGDENSNADRSEAVDPGETSKHSDQPSGLGDILKGAPFENEVHGDSEASGTHATNNPESESSPRNQKAHNTPSLPNGGPRKQPGHKTSSPPKSKPGSSRPSTINTNKGPSESAKTSLTSPTHAKKSPNPPGSPDVTSHHPPSKAGSPRQPIPAKTSGNTAKEIKKAPIPKQTQAPAAGRAPAAPATKPRPLNVSSASNPAKKAGPSSPTLKVRPKSPTRPVRLPAAATATTASSAAKSGEAPPLRPASRTGAAGGPKPSAVHRVQPSGASREAAATAGSSLRKSSSRPSLPAATNPIQKSKARTSTASAKAPEGSFLARMMRPTQSSASKVHEKIEHAAVSAKSHGSKPKRKSGGSDERGQESEEALPSSTAHHDERQTPPPVTAEEPEADTGDGTEAVPATTVAVEG